MFNRKLKFFLLLLAAFLPSFAMAQFFSSNNTSPTDVAVTQFLKPLFGSIAGGGGSDPMSELFGIFNNGVMFLGGIMLAYTIFASVLSTAHDGEMMGKRWSSLWVPIRTVLGAAAILPTVGAGSNYAVIQALVMWFALQGVNMANVMWTGYIDSQDPVSSSFYSPPNASRQIRGVFNDMFLSNVCVEGFKKTQSYIGAGIASVGLNPLDVQARSLVVGTGFAYGDGVNPTLCGSVVMSNALAGSGPADPASAGGPASATALFIGDTIAQEMAPVHTSHVTSAQPKMAVMAKKLVDNTLTQADFDAEMNSMIKSYMDDLRNKAQSVYESKKSEINSRVKEGMKRDGFALAGMYYMAIVRAQDEVTRAITQTPTASSGVMSGSGSFGVDTLTSSVVGAVGSAFTNMYVNGSERAEFLTKAKAFMKSAQLSESSSFQVSGEEATESSWVMKVVNWFVSDDLTALGNSNYSAQNQNPIIMAKNLGENMTATAWGALAIGVVVLGLSGVGAGVLGDWATVLTPLLFSLFSLMVVPGAVLSTYVPMIPYILWVGVMIGWIILVIEAIIGSVIWALSHLAPDGDGVVGRGGQGYMLVLSLVLRPPLMIFGLAASIALMKPMGFFINSTFMGAFGIAVNPGPFGVTQAIAGCIIYTVVMVSVIHRVFTLIHVIPDKILRWIGGGGNELGQEANSMESFSAGKVGAGLMAAKAAGDLSQSTMQGVRDMNRKTQDRSLADASRKEESGARMAQIDANKNDTAHRQGLEAQRASAAADQSPNDPVARDNAEFQNQQARDARIDEAQTSLDHHLAKNNAPGREALNAMSPESRQQFKDNNPHLKSAVEFNEAMNNASQQQASNPNSGAMKNFLNNTAAHVRNNSHSAQSWERSASKGLAFENERSRFSGPPTPPTNPNED